MKITEKEKDMLIEIADSYEEHGVNNTEFYNLYGGKKYTDRERKTKRGIMCSLIKKDIIRHVDDKGCFNPIFPGLHFKEALKEINYFKPTGDSEIYEIY